MLRKNDSDLVDTISSLPDSILGLILSFLPTKEAVLTSLLSKRWKLAWVTVHNLDFFYVGCWKEHNEDENMNFVRFVNRVLLLNDVGLLNKFSLVWHPWCISSYCSSWINTAVARNIRHLSLSGQFDLPESVFSCDSLQSLELKGRICVPDVFVVCLPRLESLELDGVDFRSEEALEKLIKGCSMLNNLCLDIYGNDDDGFTYMISSTSLRRFELCFKHKCSLKLKACSLEYIEVFGCISETFAEENLSSLVGAYFSIHLLKDEYEFVQDDFCNSIVEAVRAFDHGKALNLSADALRPITRFHPGRVFNMLRRQSLRPDNIGMFVLQEALLSREFEDQIYDIFQLLPPKIQVGLFSATMAAPEPSREIITRDLMMNKKGGDELTLEGISQCYIKVEDENGKLETLYNLVESMFSTKSVVFVNTRRKVDWLTDKTRRRGGGRFHTSYNAIHGDMDKITREIIMRRFRRSGGGSCVLITNSSNLFFANEAGGINNVPREKVSLVINYDVPSQPEKYLHRCGQPRFGGRNNNKGAISFTKSSDDEEEEEEEEERLLFEIQKFYNLKLKKL